MLLQSRLPAVPGGYAAEIQRNAVPAPYEPVTVEPVAIVNRGAVAA
jgi:hypothetical protein